MRYTWLQIALGVGILVVVTRGGGHGDALRTVTQVQQAFVRQGLSTQVVLGPDGCPKSYPSRSQPQVVELINACAAARLAGPHLTGLVADVGSSKAGGALLSAYVLDSTASADRYAPSSEGVVKALPWRLQQQNVVVLLEPRGRKYAPRVRAALATLARSS